MSFDGINNRLYFYVEDTGIKSFNLDGSNSTTIELSAVTFFAVDGRNNLIYFYHNPRDRLIIYDITNNQQQEVAALSGVNSAKDIDVHETSGYVLFFIICHCFR